MAGLPSQGCGSFHGISESLTAVAQPARTGRHARATNASRVFHPLEARDAAGPRESMEDNVAILHRHLLPVAQNVGDTDLLDPAGLNQANLGDELVFLVARGGAFHV